MSVLADAKKFVEVKDDTLLANFIKRPWKKNEESGACKEPQSPQDVESPSAPMQEEELEEEEFLNVTMRDTKVPEEDTAPVDTEEEEDLVTPVARIVELELQV